MLFRRSLAVTSSLLLVVVHQHAVQAQSSSSSSFGGALVVDPACPLDCKYNGICTQGDADYSQFDDPNFSSMTTTTTAAAETGHPMPFLRDANMGGYHCDCPPGRTGLLCDRQYESCGDGQHYCFHGGQCMTGLNDQFGNKQFFCDVSVTNKSDYIVTLPQRNFFLSRFVV